MNPIISLETAPHYMWGLNCQSWVFVESDGLSVKRERMPAGSSERPHFHRRAHQCFYVLRGTATMTIDEREVVIREGEGLLVAANAEHWIANNTAAEVEFLVISQPTTKNDRINLEETSTKR
jgi:mannose-6-phosphate isomerase-like protein (cupin superfamily)